MESKSFGAKIEVPQAPAVVFKHLQDVSKWWGKEDLEGSSAKLNDEFTVTHGNAHYSKQKLIEVTPNKKIVWLVTESNLNWIENDKHEWTNTKMVFEITTKGDKTILQFTHECLVQEKECYHRCSQGWDMVIKDWLFSVITGGNTKTSTTNHKPQGQ